MAETANPVHAGGQDQPMPMHARVLRQLVGHIDAHAVAFDCLDRRTCGLAVIAPQMCNHAIGQFPFHRFCNEVKFLHPVVHPVRQRPAV